MKEDDNSSQMVLNSNPFFPSKPGQLMTQSLTEKSPSGFIQDSDKNARSQKSFTPLGVFTTAPSDDDIMNTQMKS